MRGNGSDVGVVPPPSAVINIAMPSDGLRPLVTTRMVRDIHRTTALYDVAQKKNRCLRAHVRTLDHNPISHCEDDGPLIYLPSQHRQD